MPHSSGLSVLLIRKYFKQKLEMVVNANQFECLVNSEVFQTLSARSGSRCTV